MLLFDWSKVYDQASGNILQCNIIMEMIIRKYIPRNKSDPLYRYSKVNFTGRNFLLHPDILLYNMYKYEQRDIAIYYAMSALRNIADYKATKKITLDIQYSPVEITTLTDNKLLRIDNRHIHFIYEEVPQEIIH
jgi:hypothetical protein|tara:strand:- start:431 stop:832 length:402 start_codon:yes stop_codon:yes gene_type:complete